MGQKGNGIKETFKSNWKHINSIGSDHQQPKAAYKDLSCTDLKVDPMQ